MNSLMCVFVRNGSEKKVLFYGTLDEIIDYCANHHWVKWISHCNTILPLETEIVSKVYWFGDYESCCRKRIQTYSMRELWRVIYRYCRTSRIPQYYTYGVTINNKSYKLGNVRSNKRCIKIYHTAKEYSGEIPSCVIRSY